MANFLINNLFKIAVSTLNYVSPSIIADVLLHPFDFATVLLQIGYDPEGTKYEGATLMSVIVQYALFTFYIPYLLTSMQGLQFMGMPHPSIFYYVNYIYAKEGLFGCYRGLIPKIFERMIMVNVSEKIKQRLYKDSERGAASFADDGDSDIDKFLQTLTNSICSQFFAVIASHPFHVLMVSSFAEFTYDKNSSVLGLTHAIYADDGYFGFFAGLTARLMGEILSLIFSLTYTNIINKQTRPEQPPEERPHTPPTPKTTESIVDYVTNLTRFTAFKPSKPLEEELLEVPQEQESLTLDTNNNSLSAKYYLFIFNFFRNITQNSTRDSLTRIPGLQNGRASPLLAYIPLTSKLFYYVMIRDYLSKKISNPFFLVSHCAIVTGAGWEKFPWLSYLKPVSNFVQSYIKPSKKTRKVRRTVTNNLQPS